MRLTLRSAAPETALVSVATLVTLILTVLGLCLPPSLFNDLAAGWQVWLSMQGGAPFNTQWMPDPADLSRDVPVFQAWWSPGQYLVPAALTGLGITFGQAVLISGVTANLAGLAGWWKLWRELGINRGLAAVAGVVLVTGRAYGTVTNMANLADTFLFAAAPWAAWLAWRWRDLSGTRWAALLLVFVLGMFLKLAFIVVAAASLACIGLSALAERRGKPDRQTVWLGVRAALLLVVLKLIWDWGYLRHGTSIGIAHAPEFAGWSGIFLPWGGPLLSAFSGGNLLGRIFLYPGHPLLESAEDLWPGYLLAAGATIAVVVRLWRGSLPRTYGWHVVAWLLVYGLVFSLIYSVRATVSLEERHYQPAGLILLPGVLAVLQSAVRGWRYPGWLIAAGLCAYGLASTVVHARHRGHAGVPSRHGFLHMELTAGAQAEMRRLDAAPGGRTLFIVTKAEIALEPEQGRVLCVPLDSWGEDFVRRLVFNGRAEHLVLVIPERDVANGKAEWIKTGLHGYSAWESRVIDGFVFIAGR